VFTWAILQCHKNKMALSRIYLRNVGKLVYIGVCCKVNRAPVCNGNLVESGK